MAEHLHWGQDWLLIAAPRQIMVACIDAIDRQRGLGQQQTITNTIRQKLCQLGRERDREFDITRALQRGDNLGQSDQEESVSDVLDLLSNSTLVWSVVGPCSPLQVKKAGCYVCLVK